MLKRKSIDRTTLPAALLVLAKAHMRIDFADDDALITQKLAASIDLFERLTGYGVFAADWEWSPSASDAVPPGGALAEGCNRCAGAAGLLGSGPYAVVPVMRVSGFTATNDADDDIAASYALLGDENPDTVSRQYFAQVATVEGEATITLSTGFAAIDDLAPGILDVVLRICAWLYEFREMGLMAGIDDVPQANTWLTQYWVPRC